MTLCGIAHIGDSQAGSPRHPREHDKERQRAGARASRYTGYTAYDYLEAGKDYREFAYAEQIGRVPAYAGPRPVRPSRQERTERLLAEEIVISLHEHVQVFPEDMGQLREHIRQGREPTGYEGLSRSGLTAVFDNGMDGTCCISSDAGWKYQDVLFDLGVRMADLAHQDFVIKAETVNDIQHAARDRPDRAHLRARGRDHDRERGRPARRAVRLRRAADGHRLLRGQHCSAAASRSAATAA